MIALIIHLLAFFICLSLAKLFLSSASKQSAGRRELRSASGINIVHGASGNQTGELKPTKRLSSGFFE